MRTGCRKSKNNPEQCSNYSYSKGRCSLGRVPFTCPLIKQPKPGTKKDKAARGVRAFYGVAPIENPEGLVTIDELYSR
jgi:hypothetical protein